eukprot:CAMPEP_0114584276 /NCGR_PEP_ID=MMETSP0125-20121206/7994_1 /TAXON_ID=485358 ORGANISM="Aristerostoma sp., Strain ATCC 50986" /NCGR_SAMPLE_ID=MMETSP0125 /ASSEMBLY_ACC=CAM_ASM_000245 /LENGTH=50 /DNA_ID=CAMNT_0001778541 /DNA_START=161 /DNA_END=313 /DNA_ORIENTATION=+
MTFTNLKEAFQAQYPKANIDIAFQADSGESSSNKGTTIYQFLADDAKVKA